MNTDNTEGFEGRAFVTSKKRQFFAVLEAILLICATHAVRGLILLFMSPAILNTAFIRKMLTMIVMVLMTPIILFYAKKRGQSVRILPDPFTKGYKLFTAVFLILIVVNPSNYSDGLAGVLGCLFGSVVTPVFEEILFRGYIWEKSKSRIEGDRAVFLLNTLLFCIWYMGYAISDMFVGDILAVFYKLFLGIIYGIILCTIRKKSGSIYPCILTHGILNLILP